mgnify:CR=1 FL=1
MSHPALDYSEGMTAEEQKRYINYLAERVREADLGLRARDAVLQNFLDEKKILVERLSKLDAVLSDVEDLKKNLASEVEKRKAAERKVDDLKAKLKFANKNRYGNKSYGSKKKNSSEESDRTKDKDDFDGTSSSLPGNSIANKESDSSSATVTQGKKPRDLSNRPDTYNTMGVQGASKEYRSDLSKVPGRILERKMIPVFHLEVNLVEERFEMVHYVEKGKKPKWGYFPVAGSVMTDGYNAYVFIGDELSTVEQSPNLKKAIHQVCMAHFKAKLNKALEQAGDIHARPFLSGVDFYYKREGQYDAEGLTPEERGKRRQDLESKEMLITLRQYLKIELDKDPSETTPYLREALNYLDKFWNNIFAFLKDGNLPIDNNLAERTIRPLTTQRNAMLHFGSDEGVEMAATYHSIISTVKMQGKSVWEYLGKFFTKIFNGCKDFISLRPDKIGLAICQ